MRTYQEVKQEISEVKVLQAITQVYGETAAMWMRRSRDSILRSREFLGALGAVFQKVLAYYTSTMLSASTQQLNALSAKQERRGRQITFLAHNGRKVLVFLAANTGFFGEVLEDTFSLFEEDLQKGNCEATIIGRQGIPIFTRRFPRIPYTFFDFPDQGTDRQKLLEIMEHLVQYEEIQVYFSLFHTFLSRTPTMFTIAAKATNTSTAKSIRYIFEPSPEEILRFFESEIFTALFEQQIRESQLTKASSRIMAMERSRENITIKLKDMEKERLRLSHQVTNRKQQAVFASMTLWNQ